VSGHAFFWLFFGLCSALIAASIVLANIQARRRRQALQLLAQQIGLIYQGDDWAQMPSPQLGTALFNQGSGRRFANIMTGNYGGFRLDIFDYRYTVGGGKSSQTWAQTVAVFTQNRQLPLFELRPEGFFDRVGDVFLHNDIDFDSYPVFSRRYLLRGPEQEKIRALFSSALIALFEGLAAEDKWHVEGNGNSLIFYRSNVTVDEAQIVSFREQTSAITQGFVKACGSVTV
jgi:hypothetical protein